MNEIPAEESVAMFFEMCDFYLRNYLEVEKERYPGKGYKEILLEMYERREKLKIGRNKIDD